MANFDRQAELILSTGYTFSIKEKTRFSFYYSTFDDIGVPYAEVTIENISLNLRRSIIEDTKAIFNIGYENNIGELVSGDIKNIEMGNRKITFDILSDFNKFNVNYSQWYNRYVREDFIVEDIASNLNLNIKGSELLVEYNRPNGYTVTGPGIQSIIALCINRGLSVTTKGDLIIINSDSEVTSVGSIIFDDTTGLIDILEYKDDDKLYDYIVKALPVPTLGQGDLIQVKHFKGNFIGKIIDFEIRGATNWEAKYYIKVVG